MDHRSETSYHEAGHLVLVHHARELRDRLSYATLHPGGGGRVQLDQIVPDPDESKDDPLMYAAVRVLFAGRIAETLAGGAGLSGENDHEKAAYVAVRMWGDRAETVAERAHAAAEVILRFEWGTVQNLADWLRTCSTIRESHIRCAIETAEPAPLLHESLRDTLALMRKAAGDPDLPRYIRLLDRVVAGLEAEQRSEQRRLLRALEGVEQRMAAEERTRKRGRRRNGTASARALRREGLDLA